MLAKKFVIAAAAAITIGTGMIGASTPARADRGGDIAAGIVGGLIVGGVVGSAMANDPPPPRRYYSQPPAYVDEEVVVRRPRCWRETWYDRYGDEHIRRVCR